MCHGNCYVPNIKTGYCPIHYVQKFGLSSKNQDNGLDLNCLREWIETNQRYSKLAELDDSWGEVDLRNQALGEIYGHLPSYAYFSNENEFVERNWVDWWAAVLKDVKPANGCTKETITN